MTPPTSPTIYRLRRATLTRLVNEALDTIPLLTPAQKNKIRDWSRTAKFVAYGSFLLVPPYPLSKETDLIECPGCAILNDNPESQTHGFAGAFDRGVREHLKKRHLNPDASAILQITA